MWQVFRASYEKGVIFPRRKCTKKLDEIEGCPYNNKSRQVTRHYSEVAQW